MESILGYLTDPFQYGFMVRALIVSALVGVMCPLVGGYVVTRGLGFMGDALSHAILPGMVIAFMVGVSPFLGIVPAGIAFALLIGYLARRTGVSEDTSIGILFAGLFALGLTLLAAARGLPVNLEDILLGQVLGVSRGDVWVTLGLAGGVMAVLYAFHKELVFNSFDPIGASVIGLPTRLLDYVLLALLALVIVIALQAVGIVLVIAMLITPAAAAQLLVRRFTTAMALGALLGAASAIAGLYISYYANLPSGPAMTLVATGIFALAAIFRRKVA
ncbi:MAG: metal ABC transporter permease [Chloroflexi bacterium]|nr:metal ABC transporter permease [Chloroflexota bacterium]